MFTIRTDEKKNLNKMIKESNIYHLCHTIYVGRIPHFKDVKNELNKWELIPLFLNLTKSK